MTSSEIAFGVNSEIVACKMNIEANFIHLAKLLKRVRDEKLYLSLDHKTWESYLGDPDIAIGRSTAYKLIAAWELWVEKLSVPEPALLDIGSKRLGYIAPVVSNDVEGWLSKARSLSLSDLLMEVRSFRGLSSLPPYAPSAQINPGIADLLKYKSYIEYVKDRPCMVCNAPKVEPHHWPVTRGAGGNEVEEWAIPLCRDCHNEAHRNPIKFTHDYAHKWARYFYGIILKIWGQD